MMRDHAIKMGTRRIIVFSMLFAQAICAPTGCIELCTGQQSVNSYQASGSYSSHSDIVQGTNLRSANHLNVDQRRPSNWSEHNEYVTDGGRGKVHEEKGQYVEGPKHVSYYKKNYSSSYSSGNIEGLENLSRLVQVPQISQIPVGVQTVNHEHEYDRERHRQQIQVQPVGHTISQGQRREEFGEYHTSHSSQHGIAESRNQFVHDRDETATVKPDGNWRTLDTYKTDGGHGRVYEERGQYVAGPSKVRYYKKNYTASYGTPGNPVVLTDDLQRQVQNIHREFEDLTRKTEHLTNVHDVSTSGIHGHQLVETGINSHVVPIDDRVSRLPEAHVINQEHVSENRYEKTSSQKVYGVPSDTVDTIGHRDTVNQRVVQGHYTAQQPTYPAQNVYGKGHHVRYEGQYAYGVRQPVYVPSGSTQNAVVTSESLVDESRRRHSNVHETSATDLTSSRHVGHNDYGRQTVVYPSTSSGHVSQYEERWSSSGGVKGTSYPEPERLQTGQQIVGGRYDASQHHESHQHAATHASYGQSSHSSGYSSGYRRIPSGQLVTGTIDLGQVAQSVDCTDETAEHLRHDSHRYHRMYKRNVKTGRPRAPWQNSFRQSRRPPMTTSEDLQAGQQTQEPHFPNQGLNAQMASTVSPNHEDLQQHTSGVEDFSQQTSGNLEDLQQHTGGFDDFSQQTSGKLEFGQQTQKPRKPGHFHHRNKHLENFGNHNDDLQQHTGGFDDFSQQTSGNLEFGQQTQKPGKPGHVHHGNQHLENFGNHDDDLQQHTGGFDDFTQQTSANLEFGQQTQKPGKPGHVQHGNQHLENFGNHDDDLQQHTGGFDDFTQQTSGNLEFGQQTQKPGKPGHVQHGNQHLENLGNHDDDLQQHTGGFDDFTQQTSGNLEFGQQTQKPGKPGHAHHGNQHLENLGNHDDDLQQHTGGFDDFTQQTSGNLEFGQQTQKPGKPGHVQHGNQHLENLGNHDDDLQQHTGGFDDFTQQTSGNLEFGQQTQKPGKPGHVQHGNQHLENFGNHDDDLQQHTGGFDDFAQQTSGNLEFGQQTQKPRQPGQVQHGSQHVGDFEQHNEDLHQHTGGFHDFSQQTPGNLEFGQQTQKPGKPGHVQHGNQHLENFGNHDDDLQLHTGGFDDFTQQTSGNLELGQQTQKPGKPGHVQHGNQHLENFGNHNEDLQQHTGGFDDFTQQTSGNLEFGQQTQKPRQPGQVQVGNQHLEVFGQHDHNLEQQTGGFDDFTQQTSGNLEFGQQTQKPRQPDQVQHGSQHVGQQSEDLQQHTGSFDDFTQQTSGNLEFGQQTQKPRKPGQVQVGNQHLEDFGQRDQDLEQHTGGFDDFTQQTSGNFEFGQQTQKPRQPGQVQHGNEHLEDLGQHTDDLQQHTGGFDDFTQQTSGNFEFGHQQTSEKDDLQQHSGHFDDFSQQTSGDFQFGQQTQHGQTPTSQQHLDNLQQQTTGHLDVGQQAENADKSVNCQSTLCRKPAPKPTPKARPGRGSRYGMNTLRTPVTPHQQEVHGGDTPQNVLVPVDVKVEPEMDDIRGGKLRGDQDLDISLHKTTTTEVYDQHTGDNNMQQQQNLNEWGLQWHQMHKPSDLTSEYSRQQSQEPVFQSQSQTHFDQETEFSQTQQKELELAHLGAANQQQQALDFSQHDQKMTNENVKQGWEQQTDNGEVKLQPRILEAYGSSGPYDPSHDEDVFSGITVNPTATLPPYVEAGDPWIVREKPRQFGAPPMMTVTPVHVDVPNPTTEAPPPSFWGRVSHKITTTIDKAKEKAKEVFG